MEDISLPHDTRVEDILADYFTKKIEGKDVESKEKHSDSQHSSKSKKSKKRKHKKKKKHKSRKAHSENEADEANSSADECWVEVTASSTKENPAKNEAGSPDREPKEKSPSKSKPADTNLSRQDMPQKDGAGTDADKRRAGKGDHQRDTVGKNRTDQAEPSKHSTRRSSQSTSPAKSKGASSSSDSEDDRRNTSKSEPSSSQSANEGSSKKSTKKKGRSYRTKRCRSSGSSEDESDRQSQSRSPSPLRRDSSRRSGQRRSRSASKSRRNSLSKGSARDRSKSKDRKLDRSRDRSRSRKRSSRSRSLHRGHGGSHRSRSPMRSQAGSSRSQKRPESRRSSSPRRSRAARSHSRRRSRSRHSRGRTPPRHSRGRPSPRRSRSRRRSQSRHRPRQSPGRSPKRSQRSTSRDRRHGRKSVSPKKERKSRSRSRKRSTSRQKHSSRRSRSGDRKQSEKRKAVERDKSSEKKGTSGETSLPGDTGVSTTDSKKRSVSKSSEEISGKGHTGDRKSSSDSDKNQVVLYGPFEEEDGSFLDEEPSPERTMPSVKPPQPEACAAAVGKTSKPQPVTDNLEAVPVPEEPAVPPDDSQLEDMDISNPPSPVGALEVDDSLAKSVPSGENTFSPAVPPECGTETSSQQHTPPLKVDSLEESAKKPSMARAAIPWTYSEPQQAPLPPPWVKPETTKPVGQVRPFVREVNPSGSALQKGLLQTKQDGLAVVGTMATVQASNEPPLMGPGRTIGKTEEFGMLENTVKVNEHASFPELATKLVPPAPFTSAPAVPAVNLHGSALYSATVMPVHIPFQFVGVPGQAQVTHGTPTPLPQEKPSPVTQQQQTCPLPTQLGPAGKMLASEQSGPTAAPSQTEGQVLNEVVPPASTKSPPSQLPEDMATDQVGGTAGSAKVKSQSNSSSRSSSPVEKGSSRSSSMERSKSSRSRSRSGDREKAKRSRSSESESPTKDSKRLRKGDSTEREEIRAKSRSRDRHCSSSPDRSKRDSHLKKKSRSPDRKPSKSIDRKRSRSHDRKRSESPERKRSKSRDRKRSKSRERRGSKSRDRKRSQSREKKRSKSRDRKRSKSRDRKRSKSREKKRSKSRDRKRSKSHERKRSKSRERKRSKSREKRRSKSRDRRGSRSRDRRRSKSRDRRRSLSRGRQRVSQRSNSRSRRSRSRDQPRRQSRSRETGHSQRSESRKTNSSQRKPSRERESPRGTLILKRYKNELSSESDSSPERRSKKAPSSPVKKRQRRESDAESTDSQDDKSLDVRTKSSENSKALNIDCIAEHCKEKELQKQQSSEKIADKETPEANTYGPVPPAEASVPSASKPVPEPQQSDETDMDDKQDDPSGTGGCPEPNTANEVSGTSIVSSSSSKENVCQVQERSAAVGSSRPAEVAASTDNRTLKNSEPLEQRQAVATSSSKSFVCGKADVLQGNPEGLSKGEENLHEPVAYEKSIIPSGEGAVSSSTGSPREQEVAESDEARCDASLCQKEPTEKASTPATEPVSACADSSKDSNAEQRTISAREQADPSSTGDAGDTLDVKRKSRSRSRSSASSIEKARMRKESSSSSSSSSEEEHTLKEGSKSRSASPDSQSEEGPAESQVKKTQDKKRSRSREMKRSRSRDKRRSRSREKKRSRSREKKRSKSREKRRSRSRDKSLRSKEKKRSKSRERKISPSRDKKRSRSREKRRSRSREKITIRSRDKRRSRSRERKRSPSRDNRDKRRSSREQRRSRSRDKRRSRSRDKKRSPSRDRKRSRSRERRRSRDKKSRSRSRDKRRSRSREKRRSRSRPRRSWSRAMELQRKRSAERLRKKSRSPRRRSLSKRRSPRKKSRSRSRSRRRSRSHSPERKRKSRSREREPSVVKVDKVQLLEAARKNMQAMLQRGVVAKGLPVAAAAAVNATVKVVAAAVAAAAADPRSSLAAKLDVTATPPSEAPVLPLAMSGDGTGPAVTLGITEEPPKVKKSLAALTEICKAISDEEKREYAGEVEPKTAEEVAEEFQQTHHHPFKLKDPPPPIRFNIPNATNLPVKTLAEKVADAAHLHKQFPVSSGSQHRVKELEWVPVEKTEPAAPVKAARAAKSHTHREEGSTSPLALTPPPAPASTHMPPYPDTFTPLPTVAAAPPVFQVEEVPLPVSSAVISSTVMEPPDAAESLDITAIMSRRVEALKALRENPMDLEAMKVYHSCHKEFQAWIASKQEPGQYTGSIDFKPLTPDELSGPNQAWVKKDQFMKAAPVCEGIGMHLLRKMGWTPGEGLGKNKEGALEPLLPSIKTDKKGLVSELETKRPPLPAHHDLGGKHPVSALTELCIKSRWGPPEFTLAEESGPDHKKTFLFKVKVNGREYQPREPSANKKHARAQAAMLCLQETGVIGRGYSLGVSGQMAAVLTHQDIDLMY
ncbi:uncharacterized protein LOC144098921 isoform X2 [Amblyomma americanum]